MDPNFADDLLAAIAEKGSPVCAGLDPVFEKLPEEFRRHTDEDDQVAALDRFCREALEIVAPTVPAVKIQSAYFEWYGAAGVKVYEGLVDRAHELDLMVIGDVKRGDIGSTAEAYAKGHLTGVHAADAITVNGYFGQEGLQPFVDLAAEEDRGVFILVRTSNKSAAAIQDFTSAAGRKFFEHMALEVANLGAGEGLVGAAGYSCVGAVVGATYPQEAKVLREMMPQQIFLVPGYGAQGATAADCAAAFNRDGTGAIVNASRSVLFAYKDKKFAGMDWKQAIDAAARAFAADIANAVAK